MHNVHDDVICCKAPRSNLDFANTFLHFFLSQTAKFKDYQHFRVFPPNLETGYPAQQLIHLLLHSNYTVGSHLSNFSYPNLHLPEPQIMIFLDILLCIKQSALYTNSIVSLIQTFQLSEHSLVPVCSDKWLPTACITIEWCRRTHSFTFDH